MTRFTVLALHRRAGKTTLAVAKLLTAALCQTGGYVYISPQKNQSRTNMWDLMKGMLENFLNIKTKDGQLVEIRESDLSIRFWNGSKIWLLGAEDPDKIRGAKITGAVIDEVAQMPREIWSEVVRPALMDTNGWALFIGTPKGINLFSELYHKGATSPAGSEWSARSFTVYDTKVLPDSEIESYRNEVDANTFRREMLCDFSASGDDQLLSVDEVNSAMERVPQFDPRQEFRPLMMGIDVARYGNDKSVIFFRRGNVAKQPIVVSKLSLYQFAEIVRNEYNRHKPDYVYVDSTGLGASIVDILSNWHIPAIGVNFSNSPDDSKFKNKRSEMWYRLAQWITHGGTLAYDNRLLQELAAPMYYIDDKGKIALEKKDDIKKRIGFSPDLADALALTFTDEIDEIEFNQKTMFINSKGTTPRSRFMQRNERRMRKPVQQINPWYL